MNQLIKSLALIGAAVAVLLLLVPGINATPSPTNVNYEQLNIAAMPFARIVDEVGAEGGTSFRGSGTLIDKNGNYGLVLTCNHVIDTGGPYWLRFPGGDEYEAVLLDYNSQHDLAALKIAAPVGREPVPLGAYDGKGVFTAFGFDGDEVLSTIKGRPLGTYGAPGSYEHSFVSISGSPKSGDSGAGCLNERHELVGVLWGGFKNQDKDGLVTMGKPVTNFLKNLVATGKWRPSYNFSPGGSSFVADEKGVLHEIVLTSEEHYEAEEMGLFGGLRGGGGNCPGGSCIRRPGGGGGGGGAALPRRPSNRKPVESPIEVKGEKVVFQGTTEQVLLGAGIGVVLAIGLSLNRYN